MEKTVRVGFRVDCLVSKNRPLCVNTFCKIKERVLSSSEISYCFFSVMKAGRNYYYLIAPRTLIDVLAAASSSILTIKICKRNHRVNSSYLGFVV